VNLGGEKRLPVYLVKGDDASLVSEAVRALVRELVGDEDPALVVEEIASGGDDGDTTATVEAAQTPPFLTSRRVVVVPDVTAYGSAALGPLLGYLADPLDTTSVVIVGAGRLASDLTKAVKAVGHVVEAGAPVNKRARDAWLAEHLGGAPVRLDAGARELVDRHLGEDLGRLTNLLEALAAAYGTGAKVGADDVAPFLGEAGSVPPWELTDAIDRGKTDVALVALRRMVRAGDKHPLQVMAVLHSHYQRMLRLDGADAPGEQAAAALLGLRGSTYPAKKALDQLRRLGPDGLKAAFGHLAEADMALRGTKEWPAELVLEVLVARLSRLGRRGA
jgi:DNA polymerase-3 subunit delta